MVIKRYLSLNTTPKDDTGIFAHAKTNDSLYDIIRLKKIQSTHHPYFSFSGTVAPNNLRLENRGLHEEP